MNLNNLANGYIKAAGLDLVDEIPKAVWAAIAISALTQGGSYLDNARSLVVTEWDVLHENGIVPQRVPGKLRSLIDHGTGAP